jgi:HCOMODA/2-hydroxy-3-carboxy-muconic semialdehyde decarboxylase
MAAGGCDPREDVATAARAFSRLQYVHAFGHVSLRLQNSLVITPTRPPLAAVRAGDLIEVDFDGKVVSGDASARPIEVFLHIGVYRARADVGAICRTHDSCDLIHSPETGARAAASLGAANGLMLRGNGVLTVGRTVAEAAVRMWSLEERCAQAWRQGNHPAPFTQEDLAARARWYPAEAERTWTWMKYLGSADFPGGTA